MAKKEGLQSLTKKIDEDQGEVIWSTGRARAIQIQSRVHPIV